MKLKHFIIGIIIIILDQLSKVLLINRKITIIPNFLNLTYTENNGGAFGIGTKYLVLCFSIIIILGIVIYFIHQKDKIKHYIPYILILSGSIGNLIDRLFRGFVVDFIDIKLFNFPNFNIADISIVLGVFILIITILKEGYQTKRNNL